MNCGGEDYKQMRSKQLIQLEELIYEAEQTGFPLGSSKEEIDDVLKFLEEDEKHLIYSNDAGIDMILKKIVGYIAKDSTYCKFLRDVKVDSNLDSYPARTFGQVEDKYSVTVSEVFLRTIQIVSDIGGAVLMMEHFPPNSLVLCDFYIQYICALTAWIEEPNKIETDIYAYLYAQGMLKNIDGSVNKFFSDYLVYYGREIAEVAIAFLVGHEIGHNFLGHTGIQPQGYINLKCLENVENEAWKREYYADAFGIDFALKYIKNGLLEGNCFDFLVDEVFYRVDYRVLGMPVLFLASELFSKSDGGGESHPTFSLRMDMVWNLIEESGSEFSLIERVKMLTLQIRNTIKDSQYIVNRRNEQN